MEEEELKSVFHGGVVWWHHTGSSVMPHSGECLNSVQVGGDALPHENLHLLSPSILPTPRWGSIKGTADETCPVQRDDTTGWWDRPGVLCGSLSGSLSEGSEQTWPTGTGPPGNSTAQAAQTARGKNNVAHKSFVRWDGVHPDLGLN